VPSGESCTPDLGVGASCLSVPFPDLVCPAGNTQAGRIPQIFEAFPDYLCKVCEVTTGYDLNSEELVFTGTLTFGSNMMDGKPNEANIKEYRVYFVDSSTGTLTSDVLATVQALWPPAQEDCCHGDRYEVTLSDVALSPDAAAWYVAVVPVEDLGGGRELEMVTGTWVEIFDVTSTVTTISAVSNTMTTVTGTATTVSETTTTPETTYVISVSMGMSFGNPQAAVADPQVQEGVELGIAVSSGLGSENADMVAATLSLNLRRLGGDSRRLTGGNVLVEALITIPPDAPATISADSVANTLATADMDSLTAAMSEAINSVATESYSVSVTSAPTVAVEALPATKTTTTQPGPSTTSTTSTVTTSTVTTSTSTATTTTTLAARAGAASPADWQAEPSALLAVALAVLLAQNMEL